MLNRVGRPGQVYAGSVFGFSTSLVAVLTPASIEIVAGEALCHYGSCKHQCLVSGG